MVIISAIQSIVFVVAFAVLYNQINRLFKVTASKEVAVKDAAEKVKKEMDKTMERAMKLLAFGNEPAGGDPNRQVIELKLLDKGVIRVWAVQFVNYKTAENQIVMAIGDSLEIAKEVAMGAMVGAFGGVKSDWAVLNSNHMDLKMLTHPVEIKEEPKKETRSELEIGKFTFNLRYIRDRFAESSYEKGIISKIINRIEKQYATGNK